VKSNAQLVTTENTADPFESIRAAAPFSIVYADPPWYYEGGSIWDRGGTEGKYDTQKCDWIARLPVPEVMAWDSVCFMWATYPRLPEAIYVLRAWGFDYRTVAFTWVKINSKSGKPYFGMGAYTRANAEICLLGVRGQTLERKDKGVPQLIQSDLYEHSIKPQEARDRIVRLYGDVPRLEMFARRDPADMFPPFDGWTIWGNQAATTQHTEALT
jgi:N6-adenosine-specific RNA methylase IME4